MTNEEIDRILEHRYPFLEADKLTHNIDKLKYETDRAMEHLDKESEPYDTLFDLTCLLSIAWNNIEKAVDEWQEYLRNHTGKNIRELDN